MFLIAFGALSGNLERLYALCVCRKTLTLKEVQDPPQPLRGRGKICRSFQSLVNSAEFVGAVLGRRHATNSVPVICNNFASKWVLRLSLDLETTTLLVSRLLLEHGNG